MLVLAWIAPLVAFALATPIKDPYPYTSDISLLTKYTPTIYQCQPRINATCTVIFPKSLLPRWIDCKTLCGDKLTLYDPKTRRSVSATIIGFDQYEKDDDLIVTEAVWRYFGGKICEIDWGFCEDDKDDYKPKKPHSTPLPRPSHPAKPTYPVSYPPQKSPAVPPRPQTPVKPSHPVSQPPQKSPVVPLHPVSRPPVVPSHPVSQPPQKSPAAPWVPPRQPSGTPHPSQASPHPSQAPRV